MSALKKAMREYKRIHFILTMSGSDIPSEALLENEEIGNAVHAVVMAVGDLRVANAVLDLTDVGYTQSAIPVHVNKAIETLFLARAKEILDGVTDIKRLQKLDKQIDAYAKKEVGCRNHFKSDINSRIAAL